MPRDPLVTSAAPRPLGPYSQAVRAGGFIFVAGQLPLDPVGAIVGRGDIKAQTAATLSNIAAILKAGGSSLDKVVKTTVFLTNLDHFADMNEVYASTFHPPYPARSTVEIGPLPKGMLIQIECVAVA
jgi:2-iminobutanoate/2-iminopropanoate deaminase